MLWAVNRLVVFSTSLAVFTALAAVALFLAPHGSLGSMLAFGIQYEALALAASILIALVYYRVMGIQKGDQVLVVHSEPMESGLSIRIATALENAKLHQPIKISFAGMAVVGEVDSYPGIIYPARVSVKAENNMKVI